MKWKNVKIESQRIHNKSLPYNSACKTVNIIHKTDRAMVTWIVISANNVIVLFLAQYINGALEHITKKHFTSTDKRLISKNTQLYLKSNTKQ